MQTSTKWIIGGIALSGIAIATSYATAKYTNIDIKKLKAYKALPTLQSRDVDWLKWMKELDSEYGRDDATTIFLKLWTKRGSQDANTYTLRHTLDNDYGIQIDETVFNKIVDFGGGALDTVSGYVKMGKLVFIVVGGAVALGGVALLVTTIKSLQGSIQTKIGK